MNFFHKSLLLILLPVSLFLFKSNFKTVNIYAQGTCSCETGTSCVVTSSNNHCLSGYIPSCSGGYCPYPAACNCVTPTPGTCSCETSTSCVVVPSNNHCLNGNVPYCPGNYCPYPGACSCVTPTPAPMYSCHWISFGLGECRLSDDSACQAASCYGDCSRFGETGGGGLEACSANHVCICSTPTPAPPTEYQDCQEQCVNPTYPVGNCLDTQGIDPPGCVNPPGNNDYNCEANDLDCLCCTELLEGVTPRDELNPFCGAGSINTAVGCLPVGDKNSFLVFLLRWAIGITGGVSFVLIIYSGFMIMTAGGDKRRLQSGKELLTAAISGLMLIVFSVFILDLIGIRILKIPGL